MLFLNLLLMEHIRSNLTLFTLLLFELFGLNPFNSIDQSNSLLSLSVRIINIITLIMVGCHYHCCNYIEKLQNPQREP